MESSVISCSIFFVCFDSYFVLLTICSYCFLELVYYIVTVYVFCDIVSLIKLDGLLCVSPIVFVVFCCVGGGSL